MHDNTPVTMRVPNECLSEIRRALAELR